MKKKYKNIRKGLIIGLSGAILLGAAIIMVWRSFTYSYDEMRRCTTVIECRSYYSLSSNGKPIIYFYGVNADSTLAGITTSAVSASNNIVYATGFWVNKMPVFPSCYGHIATAFEGKNANMKIKEKDALRILSIETGILKQKQDSLKSEAGELKYYLKVHGVQDMGYNMIAKYAAKVNMELNSIDSILAVITNKEKLNKLSFNHISEYAAIYYDANNNPKRVKCEMKAASHNHHCCLLQTMDKKTPDGVCTIFFKPWACILPKKVMAASYAGLGNEEFSSTKAKANIIAGTYTLKKDHDIPLLFAADGSPVFSHRGRLVGIISGKKIINRKRLAILFDKEK